MKHSPAIRTVGAQIGVRDELTYALVLAGADCVRQRRVSIHVAVIGVGTSLKQDAENFDQTQTGSNAQQALFSETGVRTEPVGQQESHQRGVSVKHALSEQGQLFFVRGAAQHCRKLGR